MSDLNSKVQRLLNDGWDGEAYTEAISMENSDVRDDLLGIYHPFNHISEDEVESGDWNLIASKGLDCE